MSGLLARLRRLFDGLAGRLLVFSLCVVFSAALLFFAPIVAAFQTARINDRLNLAETAAIALDGSSELQDDLQRNLIEEAEILRIALGSEEGRELLLESPLPRDAPGVPRTYDYRNASAWQRIAWAIETLTSPPGRVLLVLGKPRYQAGDFVEILINERPLKQELWAYAGQVLLASLLISALAAAAIYYLLTWLFVRPVERLTYRVERFSKAPEDASIFAKAASPRADEIGRAERALADMAEHVRASLRQRERLAALGAAVARIAHDLRNVLSTAQLVTERLGKSEDPGVKQAAPRLERAIGRAAGLAAAALRYGKAEEAAPVLSPLRVHAAVSEALDDALAAFPTLSRRAAVSEDLIAIADPDSVHRILVNLIRNAAQAAAGVRPDTEDAVLVSAERRGAVIVIAVKDRGGGVPDSARAILFQPFVSADRAGGAGLGLAISRELARAQGGDVRLAETSAEGAVFEATLPAA